MICRLPGTLVKNLTSTVLKREEADEKDDTGVQKGLSLHPEEILRVEMLSALAHVV